MLRWLTTLYRQPDPLANSAKICPIKPNRFSTEPSSNDRLAEALRTRNPRWTTRALWYPPAQSRRHLPNAGSAVGRTGTHRVRHQRPCPQSTGQRGHSSIEMRTKRPTCVELPSGDAADGKGTVPKTAFAILCSHPGGQTHRRRRKHAPARHVHNLNRHESRQGIGIVAAHCERCRQCLRANVQLQCLRANAYCSSRYPWLQ